MSESNAIDPSGKALGAASVPPVPPPSPAAMPPGNGGKRHRHSAEELGRAFRADRGKQIDLFVYGTLMNDEYVRLLLKRTVPAQAAKLHHHLRVAPSWSFPFVVKHHGAVCHGRILKGLDPQELKIIDEFEDEGRLYHRTPVVARAGDLRQRCQTYVGDIQNLQKSFGRHVQFEDRLGLFLEAKINATMAEMPSDRPDIDRRVLNELMGSAVDNIIKSHFDGNYICNYIMIRALEEAKPPSLLKVLGEKALLPYAGNYMRLACQHIVFNQFVERIRHEHPDAVRLSRQYYRHGLGVLLAFMLYNRQRAEIDRHFADQRLGSIVEGRNYHTCARLAIGVADACYDAALVEELIAHVAAHWYSTPTPLGAELEFSNLGSRAIHARPGEDPVYDSFYWFRDFDLFRRTWRLGGHIDSHSQITIGQHRHRGFLEYALGRFQIVGDLSLPLFDCPWGMSLLINEAVRFLDIKPHSLHLSFELGGRNSQITDRPHAEEDLACLLLLGGDLRPDATGALREWRIYNNELDTNASHALNFSARKFHFSREDQTEAEAADVMEYKFMRLRQEEFDYTRLIVALKGYQFHVKARPISIRPLGHADLPEQAFLRRWAGTPQTVDPAAIDRFVAKVEQGLLEEHGTTKLERFRLDILARIHQRLTEMNQHVASHGPRALGS
jgi:gamma-glutamylcyclotransferase (GGCT)/AIG2-like uncharacterized protein YtfP